MSGYVPIFASVFTGSLHGRWPDVGLWLALLALADRHGVIDCSPQYIASVTGLPVDEVVGAIERLSAPDPASRSPDEGGRRLVALDPARGWGWQVVNFGRYRERARLMAKDSARTASGRDAERKAESRRAERREASPDSSACPPESPAVPLSDKTRQIQDGVRGRERAPRAPRADGATPSLEGAKRASRLPDDFELTVERRAVAERERVDPERTFAKFVDHWRAASGANARKLDWSAAWRNWCRREAESRGRPNGRSAPDSDDRRPLMERLKWRPDPKDDVEEVT